MANDETKTKNQEAFIEAQVQIIKGWMAKNPDVAAAVIVSVKPEEVFDKIVEVMYNDIVPATYMLSLSTRERGYLIRFMVNVKERTLEYESDKDLSEFLSDFPKNGVSMVRSFTDEICGAPNERTSIKMMTVDMTLRATGGTLKVPVDHLAQILGIIAE